MKKILLPLAALAIVLSACGGDANQNSGNTDTTTAPPMDTMATTPPPAQGGMQNNIQLTANGLTVTQAYLKVGGDAVADDNKVNQNDKVDLHLSINGWKTAPGGKINIGASQQIRNSAGKVLLDEKDIFGNRTISVEDANDIILSAIIAKAENPNDTYTVTFRVWDKDNGADVNGSYSFSHK